MFEKFAGDARDAVTQALESARQSGATAVTSAHLLGALVSEPGSLAARASTAVGLDPATVLAAVQDVDDALDAQALAAIGIDLGAVRSQVEARFGDGALDRPRRPGARRIGFARDAKKLLELALREATAAHDRTIDSGHLLMATTRLEERAPAAVVLASLDVDQDALRTQVARLRTVEHAA